MNTDIKNITLSEIESTSKEVFKQVQAAVTFAKSMNMDVTPHQVLTNLNLLGEFEKKYFGGIAGKQLHEALAIPMADKTFLTGMRSAMLTEKKNQVTVSFYLGNDNFIHMGKPYFKNNDKYATIGNTISESGSQQKAIKQNTVAKTGVPANNLVVAGV